MDNAVGVDIIEIERVAQALARVVEGLDRG